MHQRAFLSLLLALSTLCACGDDTDGTDGTTGGGGVGEGGAGGGGAGQGGDGTGGAPEPVPCGEDLETCDAGLACIVEANEPDCENLPNPDDPCPEGTTKTQCGGAGMPCCCGPTPAPTYSCVSTAACDGAPTCECLDPCDPEDDCSEGNAEGTFQCDPLPMP